MEPISQHMPLFPTLEERYRASGMLYLPGHRAHHRAVVEDSPVVDSVVAAVALGKKQPYSPISGAK